VSLYLLEQSDVVLVTELVVKRDREISGGLEAFERDHFLVAGGNELVLAVSLDDGAKVASGGLHHLHGSRCCTGFLTEFAEEHHFVDC